MSDQDKDTIIQQQRDIIALMQNPMMVVNTNLRDQFAIAALNGLLASGVTDYNFGEFAQKSYILADAMMMVREQKK